MAKRSDKRDSQQKARQVPDQVDPIAETKKLPAPNKAKPPRPVKTLDAADIEQADAEGMAQPQGVPPPKRKK